MLETMMLIGAIAIVALILAFFLIVAYLAVASVLSSHPSFEGWRRRQARKRKEWYRRIT